MDNFPIPRSMTSSIKRVFAYYLVVLSAGLTSCIGEKYTGPDPNLPSRTVLVYMAADNSLADETERKIESLRQGWTWTGNKCLIYVDTPHGARLLRLRGGCQTTPTPYVETVREYGAENSASAAVFGRVLREVFEEYPADSYGLVFFSHASGWLPDSALRNPSRSLGRDDGSGDGMQEGSMHSEMELTEFAEAIPDGRLDFILFEACLTAGIEVAYELCDKTDCLLVSSAEILSPGFTPIYPSALRYLFDTSKSVEESLIAFGECYMNHVNGLADNYRSATLSLIVTDGLHPFAARTRELLTGLSTDLSDIIADLQHFDRPGSYGDTPAVARYFDMAEWMKHLADEEQYTVFEKQLSRIVKWKACTDHFLPSQNGFTIRQHSGLTIYIERPELPSLNEYYHSTAWYKALHEN